MKAVSDFVYHEQREKLLLYPVECKYNYIRYSEIFTFIFLGQWSEVSHRIKTHPLEVRQFHTCFLPISHAIICPDVPISIVSELIVSYPESLSTFDVFYNRLPLHWSLRCQSPNIELLKLLIQYYPEAIMKQDKDGQSPLTYYFWFCNDLDLDIIKLFINKYPKLLELRDYYQWLPLHHAVKHGKWDIINYIINKYPNALFEVDMIGLVPRLHADRKGRNKGGIWDKVLKEEYKWFELIKEKKNMKDTEDHDYDFTYIGNFNDMTHKNFENFEKMKDEFMIKTKKHLKEYDKIMLGYEDARNKVEKFKIKSKIRISLPINYFK